MIKNLSNKLVYGALIVSLSSDVLDMTSSAETDGKFLLQSNEESKLCQGLLVHTVEASPENRLIRPTVASGSGIQAVLQSKLDKYELFCP